MTYIPPPLVILISAFIGAVLLTALFNYRSRQKTKTIPSRLTSPLAGAILGGIAGAVGSSLFMVPLEFCTFDPELNHGDPNLTFALGIILIMVGIAVALYIVNLFVRRYTSGSALLEEDTALGAFKGKIIPALLLLPTMAVIFVFIFFPVLDTFRLSTLLARLGAPRTRFICLDNFTRLADNPDYIQSVVISLVITAAIVVIGLGISLLIATMAYQPIRGARLYRILLVWPYALSPVIAGAIFRLLFNPTAGVINHVIEQLGGEKVEWLLDPNIAPITVIIASIWNISGYNILFYIAGLQNVPKDLQEAASIDGANPFQTFMRITFPLLSPITFFLIVTNTTYAFFNTFGLIDFLTTGGPVGSTTTMMYSVYEVGIVNRDLGKGAAESLVLFLFVIVITIVQFRTSRNRVTFGA